MHICGEEIAMFMAAVIGGLPAYYFVKAKFAEYKRRVKSRVRVLQRTVLGKKRAVIEMRVLESPRHKDCGCAHKQ
jgi:hypothetical protein